MQSFDLTLLTPLQAARALGLSESSVRRLCDQGALESERTAGGHRRIRPGAVSAYARRAAAGSVVSPDQARAAAGRGGRFVDQAELVQRVAGALIAGDRALLRGLLRDLSVSGYSAAYVSDRVLAPALAKLGEQWCEGTLSVYREHRASEMVLECLAEGRRTEEPSARKRRALCAAPEGDPNSLASAMAAWVLAECGYVTVTLGANMPFDGLDEAVCELRPHLLVLSISHVEDVGECVTRCRSLYARTDEYSCLLALGGRALTPALRTQLRADFFGDTLTNLADYAKKQRPRKK
jgi:excisionase family DNA binding protein